MGVITPAQEAGIELEDFLAAQVKALLGASLPSVLYHYTSAAGLLSILRSGVLRARPLSQLNDMAEARFAASVFRAHLDQQYALENPGPFLEVLSAMRWQMDQGINLSNVYSLSFSSDGDAQAMWRLYADRGAGFSFCIPLSLGMQWSTSDPWGWFWRCHYGERPLTEFCQIALAKAKKLFGTGHAGAVPSTAEEFARQFLNKIAYFAPAFKPEAWANENEWRWIFVRSPDEKKPWLELPLHATARPSQLAISAVCAGPKCDAPKIRALQELLHALKHDTCMLHRSIHGDTQ